MIYLGACLIAGIRLAREKSVNHRQIPTSHAIDESVDLAHEIYDRVFRKVPEQICRDRTAHGKHLCLVDYRVDRFAPTGPRLGLKGEKR